MKQKLQTVLLFAAVMVFCVLAVRAEAQQENERWDSSYKLLPDSDIGKIVHVALVKGARELLFSSRSPVVLTTIETGERLGTEKAATTQSIKPTPQGVLFGKKNLPLYGVHLIPEGNVFTLNGKEYRGSLVVIRQKDLTLLAVNYLTLDDYVKGVIPREVSPSWPPEVLKAQAVAARTFAVFSEYSRFGNDYTLEATVASQVYGGMGSEAAATSAAVDATRGKILSYNGSIFPTFFHAACGGRTTAADQVWRTKYHPALQGTVCPFCQGTKHYYWTCFLSYEDLAAALTQLGKPVSGHTILTIADKDRSGRVLAWHVVSDAGGYDIPANAFRLAVGAERMRSTFLEQCVPQPDGYALSGYGWGHGVGICQWGAKTMAERGSTYEEILRYYFPTAVVASVF